uniref:Uncharacterized protein n=1 Tax=Arundo donax TaxID=35708 RepID=A0A0A9ECP5_ARUDO
MGPNRMKYLMICHLSF